LSESTLLGLIVILALATVFDYINGFHDTANAIATCVSTRALKPEVAILLSATANFVGALIFGVAVAKTIGGGRHDDRSWATTVLIGAWRAMPEPDHLGSHPVPPATLIGGLIGASWAARADAIQRGNLR
jgi:PiT family inorganic phosphate transporter